MHESWDFFARSPRLRKEEEGFVRALGLTTISIGAALLEGNSRGNRQQTPRATQGNTTQHRRKIRQALLIGSQDGRQLEGIEWVVQISEVWVEGGPRACGSWHSGQMAAASPDRALLVVGVNVGLKLVGRPLSDWGECRRG